MVDNFDSFEFDVGFLTKVDAEVKENSDSEKRFNYILREKTQQIDKKEKKTPHCKKTQYYDLPLSESDLMDSVVKADGIISEKVSENIITKRKKLINKAFVSCLSPIQGVIKCYGQNVSFSSTPIKNDTDLSPKTLKNEEKEIFKISQSQSQKETSLKKANDFYWEADLFEGWDEEECQVENSQKDNKSLITLSQAFELIQEAELAIKSKEFDENDALNISIDLLTGEVVGANNGTSEDFIKSVNASTLESFENKNKKELEKEFESDFPATLDKPDPLTSKREKKFDSSEIETRKKPLAAQKLNFDDKLDSRNSVKIIDKKHSVDFQSIFFDSDDDFDIFTQVFIDEPKKDKFSGSVPFEEIESSVGSLNSVCTRNNNRKTPLKDNVDELSDDSINFVKKRGKFVQISESDSADESPSPKVLRQNKKKTKRWRNGFQNSKEKEFIELEADVSKGDFSSDEVESDTVDEYDKSFVDEESYFTQNCSANMEAKYLESLKNLNNRPGTFKIPESKPYNPLNVFSQLLPDTSTDYEIDSFCVNDVEDEEMDLSDLEIAERILEIDRKCRKKKRALLQSKKIK